MIATLAARTIKMSRHESYVFGFIGLWLLSMMALPILRWTIGDSVLNFAVIATVLAQVSAVAVALLTAPGWGVTRTARAVVIVAAATWLAETVGSHTGFPFGYYYYTPLLQPQIAGVPLFIPLAWLMMLPSAWAVAQIVVGKQRFWLFTLVSAAALTAWDFFLDPQKVAWGFWVWTDSAGSPFTGGYFGIPWVNFLGWLLVAALVTWVVRPSDVPVRPLLLIYGVTWAFQFMGQILFWNLPGPALVGFAAMGSMLALVYWSYRRRLA